jgi:hypothetical protein
MRVQIEKQKDKNGRECYSRTLCLGRAKICLIEIVITGGGWEQLVEPTEYIFLLEMKQG